MKRKRKRRKKKKKNKVNAFEVTDAVKSGLSLVCATCRHYWDGRRSGALNCGKLDCCGPFGGGAFQDYSGPISDFERQCFVCGNPEVCGVFKLNGETRKFGICGRHLEMSRKMNVSDLLLLVR